MSKVIMYGDLARRAMLSGDEITAHEVWYCKGCKRIWEQNEHMASWCCCTHKTCECGEVHSKSWTICDTCRAKKDSDRWFVKPEVEWDGEFPIGLWDDDKYFFSPDDLADYLVDVDRGEEFLRVEDLRLTTCEPNRASHFDVTEYCCDELPEDGEILNAAMIDRQVNGLLNDLGILSWSMTGKRLRIGSVVDQLGLDLKERLSDES